MARYFQKPDGNFAAWDNSLDNQTPPLDWTLLATYDHTLYTVIHQRLSDNVKNATWNAVARTLTINSEIVIDGVWIDTEAARLATDAQIKSAASVAILQGKDYLRRQLLNPSPNTQTIVTTLSDAINANPYLLQMFQNQQALMQAAFAWGAIDTTTAVGRTRYILIAEQVIALLS